MRSISNRSQLDMQPASIVFNSNGQSGQSSMSQDWIGREKQFDSGTYSWWDASGSELRFASVEFMSLSNEVHYFLSLIQQPAGKTETSISSQPDDKLSLDTEALDLESAVRLFGSFICSTDTKLQAACCGFLFHHGSRSSWWPSFFPTVIRRYFVSGSNDSPENIFILLAYICDQSIRHHDLHTPIIEKLLVSIQELVNAQNGNHTSQI